MIRGLVIIIFILFTISCKNKSLSLVQNKEKKGDTIKPKYIDKKSTCYSNSLKYRKKYGFIISDFYDVSEEQIFDLDGDLKKDTIVVLSPLTLTPATSCVLKDDEFIDNRLLIISLANGNKFLFENVITNELGIGTLGAEFIKEDKKGFTLEKETGQSCSFKYEIKIKYIKNNFFIQNIIFHSSGCPYDKPVNKKIDYSNKKYLLNKYNRKTIDSLKIIEKI